VEPESCGAPAKAIRPMAMWSFLFGCCPDVPDSTGTEALVVVVEQQLLPYERPASVIVAPDEGIEGPAPFEGVSLPVLPKTEADPLGPSVEFAGECDECSHVDGFNFYTERTRCGSGLSEDFRSSMASGSPMGASRSLYSDSDAGSLSPTSKYFAREEPVKVTEFMLESTMFSVASRIKPWKEDYVKLSTIEKAPRNHGRVDLMQPSIGEGKFAVKIMPNNWMRDGPQQFTEKFASSSEQPWVDLAILQVLNDMGYPHVCQLVDIFRGDKHTYVVQTFATEGDLLAWSSKGPDPGAQREQFLRPVLVQICQAVQALHDLGISHHDLSLENIVMDVKPDGELKIRLIDFGMATLSSISRSRTSKRDCEKGKPSYRAPEVRFRRKFDFFLADAFSVGVIFFSLAFRDYPWRNTTGGEDACLVFKFFAEFGFQKLIERRRLRLDKGTRLVSIISPGFAELLAGLLQIHPHERLTLGESLFKQLQRATNSKRSVWDTRWLQGQVQDSGVQVQGSRVWDPRSLR